MMFYFSFLFRTLIKASFGTSTLPMRRIFFLPSACLFSSFIFRVMSPPYCKRWMRIKTTSCDKLSHKTTETLLLTHFARTFFLNAFTLKEEHSTTFTPKHCCSMSRILPTNGGAALLTFLLLWLYFQWLPVWRSQTSAWEWILSDAHTWLSPYCTHAPCQKTQI